MYAVMARSVRVTSGPAPSRSLPSDVPGRRGLAIAPPTLASLCVVVGGVSRRPRVVDDRIVVREVVDLTVTVDHNVVDGAPATRFGAELRRQMGYPASAGRAIRPAG